jgi:hypothetical protein
MCIPINVAFVANPLLPNEVTPDTAHLAVVSERASRASVTNVTEEKPLSIKPISMQKAQEFVKQHHRHNKEVKFGPRFAISVVDPSGEVWGVAIGSPPVARALDDGYTTEIRRVCTRPNAPWGCCSILYGACKKAWGGMGGRLVITYTLQSESGGGLRAAGFRRVAASKGHKVGQSWDTHPRKGKVAGTVTPEPKWRWEISC